MIDLDAMHEHFDNNKFKKSFQKDKNRFLKNWNKSDLKMTFENLFL